MWEGVYEVPGDTWCLVSGASQYELINQIRVSGIMSPLYRRLIDASSFLYSLMILSIGFTILLLLLSK